MRVVSGRMSMQALDDGTPSRFARAIRDAQDLLASAQTGGAVAVVLAGEPARVAVAPTTDLSLVTRTIEDLVPPDRTTDLDGALALAASLVSGMPQPQRSVAVALDSSCGQGSGATSTTVDISRWVALVAVDLVVRVGVGTSCGERDGWRVRCVEVLVVSC